MIAKYIRFYRVSDIHVMQTPVKRFFVLYRQIRRLQAEDTLLQIRVASFPYGNSEDRSRQDFLDSLHEAAGMNSVVQEIDLSSTADMAAWGIKYTPKNPADDLTKGIHIRKKGG